MCLTAQLGSVSCTLCGLPARVRRTSSELELFHADSSWRGVRVLWGSLWAKFGSATVGSLLLLETPVLLKGPRHFATFLLALWAVQLCPGDLLWLSVQRLKCAQLVLRLSAALYKVSEAHARRLSLPACCVLYAACRVL